MYYPVEAVNEDVEKIILDYCNFDLRGKIPGLHEDEQRCILLEGPMKLIEKHGRIEVHAFLFTDVLVLTKAKKGSDKLRIIRQPFRLNKVMIHPLKDIGSFVFIYLNEYSVLVTAFTLQVSATEYAKWMQALDKAKSRYIKARAGQGSTLEFFDDDIFTTHSNNGSVNFHDVSPMPERRSITEDPPQSPSIVVTGDVMHLRSRSSVAISSDRSCSLKSEQQAYEALVKRSLSDPKPTSWSQDKRPRSRPMSLISTSDRDTASWVLTNDKRHRSGSIPSDISEDSRRSSGIGDSFRSINSDGAVPIRENVHALDSFASYPEVSNVMKLKAKFETSDGPDGQSTEGSNSSISTASVTGFSESLSTSQCATSTTAGTAGNIRRTTPPDFMENHSTIHEEEEQLSNNSYDKITDPNIPQVAVSEASSDSILTSSTLQLVNIEDSPYENLDLIRNSIKKSNTSTLTPDAKKSEERGIQCKLSHENISILNDELAIDNEILSDNEIQLEIPLVTTDEVFTDLNEEIKKLDAETQCELDSNIEFKEIAIQCQVIHTCDTNNASTQCGDFIHLSGVGESDTDNMDGASSHKIRARPSSAPPSPSDSINSYNTPMLSMLNSSLQTIKQPRGILKHSYSEANIPHVQYQELRPQLRIAHSRSRSDEPKQTLLPTSSPKQKHRNSTSTYEFPGMRALQTLSESLESSLNHRRNSANNSSRSVDKVDDKSDNNNSRPTSPNSNKATSPSLHKVALLNSPSRLRKQENVLVNGKQEPSREVTSEQNGQNEYSVSENRPVLLRTTSELTASSLKHVVLRNSSSELDKHDGKRNTWHDFDSVAALKNIERTKYGPEGRSQSNLVSSSNMNSNIINRTHSQSTEQLQRPRKQPSLKKSILKKFSSANVLELDDSVGSNKSFKKQVKEEKARQKKEKKLKDKEKKEDKKREKHDKSRKRTSSLTSSSSDKSSLKLASIDETLKVH